MLVLGIAGSPRRGGNSEMLLDEALAGAREAGATVEKAVLSELKIAPCVSCRCCVEDGECPVEDDMQELYRQISAADVLIISSPIYFYGLTGWAKAAIDRAQALWCRKYIMKDPQYTAGKKGAFIGVGATWGERLFDGARLTIKYFFDAAGFSYAAELLARGIDEKGAIKKQPHYLRAARQVGFSLVRDSKK